MNSPRKILEPAGRVAGRVNVNSETQAAAAKFDDARMSAVCFPLTPALSPEEREHGVQSVRPTEALRQVERLGAGLPLPWGEGRGEGEGSLKSSKIPIFSIAFRPSGFLLLLLAALLSLLPARAAEEIIRTNQPGTMESRQLIVMFRPGNQQERVAVDQQKLNFGDGLHTLAQSRATVRLNDGKLVPMRSSTRLEIIPRQTDTNAASINLLDGQIIGSHGGRGTPMLVQTPAALVRPKGTEYLVAHDAASGETTVTVFDGAVDLQNDADQREIAPGFQGTARRGEKIRVRPILEAKNVVQWWIYYPAVVNPDDLALDDNSKQRLAGSLAAYRGGDLAAALEKFPGYPEGAPANEAERIYYAALLLGVGGVEEAEKSLTQCAPDHPGVRALRTMMRAVAPLALRAESETNSPRSARLATTLTASEWLARSYAHQATNDLPAALAAARRGAVLAPQFGFAHARVAELEFSFGHARAAQTAVNRALELSPRHAEAHAVQGFIFAAQNKMADAQAAFDRAIALDPWLANGWLGRGLIKIRRGEARAGREDIRQAAAAEPRRALVRSYLGKAYADAGLTRLAEQELNYARTLDPNDPTAPLYAALFLAEQNRLNESAGDLEKSIRLNDNRALFRSRQLLDEDRAVRGANLARIYERAGLESIGLNEAARAVSYDQANYSAHQFLSDQFNQLRDPTRFNLRYETPWFGELLLANLLSPVGATPLSQHVSQQEYSRLFARDRVGLSSDTLVRSDHEVHELASQYGNLGNTAWAFDLDYQHNDGTDLRRNNQLDRKEWYTTFKQQLTPQDSLLLLFKYQDYESGDNFQYYDAKKSLDPHLHFTETQQPIALAGWHHEWAPGSHTLFLGGRLANEQHLTDRAVQYPLLAVSGSDVFVPGAPAYDLNYRQDFEAWTAELNQIFQTERHTFTLGGRVQDGEMTGKNSLQPNVPDAIQVPFRNSISEPADRVTGYGYWNWRALDSLLLIGGVSYDRVTYPNLLRSSPVARGHSDKDLVAPKAGFVWTPLDTLTVRGAYTKSLGGVTLDQSYRLEPTQLAGFVQTYRTLFPISLVGPVSAQEFETAGAAVELKLPSRTYVTMQFERLSSGADNTRGVLVTDVSNDPGGTPIKGAGTRETLDFLEHSAELTVGQLLDDEWSVGLRYRFARAELRTRLPGVPVEQYAPANQRDASDLHAGGVFALYNHRCGFFGQSDFTWYAQDNRERGFVSTDPNNPTVGRIQTRDLPSDNFPQWNLALGWRFPQQRGDVTFGVLNLTGENYHLSPVNFYNEQPHERVFYGRVRFRF